MYLHTLTDVCKTGLHAKHFFTLVRYYHFLTEFNNRLGQDPCHKKYVPITPLDFPHLCILTGSVA